MRVPAQGLTTNPNSLPKYHAPLITSYATRSMRLKAQNREVSERRQVGDAEELFSTNEETKGAWWRNVGMDEGM